MSDETAAVQAIKEIPADLALVKIENESIMAMAAAHPRNYAKVLESIIEQVELHPLFAQRATYSKPVGKESFCVKCKRVLEDWKATVCQRCGREGRVIQRPVFASGLSIRAAEAIAEAYGYNRVRSTATVVNPDLVSVEAVFVDYQRGRMWSKNILVSRMQKRRSGDVYRLTDERFQLLQDAKASIAIREVILRSTPPALRAALEDKVRSMVRLTPEVLAKVLSTFAGIGVDQTQLEQFLGVPKPEWTNEHRTALLETLTAIQDGETTVEAVFSGGQPSEAAEAHAEPAKEGTGLADKIAANTPEEPVWNDQGDPPPAWALEGAPEKDKGGKKRKGYAPH